MKIGILTLSLKRGGAERVVSQVSTFLAGRHDVYTILFDTSEGFDYPYGGKLLDLGLPEPKGKNPIARLSNTFKAIPKLKKIKRELKLDVMLSFLEPASIPNLLAQVPNCKSVIAITEDKSCPRRQDAQRKATDFLIRRLYSKADLIVSASKGAGHSFSQKYGIAERKIETIYNPVDLDKITKMADEPLPDVSYEKLFDSPTIISAGRLTLPKGYWHLIRAFSEVRKSVRKAKLIILGDGEQKEYLTRLTDDFGLSDCVHFLGYQANPFCFMKRADVFVLSSLWEGFGNVVLESLAVGLPVVSTDVRSGPREILAPQSDFCNQTSDMELAEYGILVPQLDGEYRGANEALTSAEQTLARGVVKLLRDKTLAREYSHKGFARAMAFRGEKILPIYEQLLSELVKL